MVKLDFFSFENSLFHLHMPELIKGLNIGFPQTGWLCFEGLELQYYRTLCSPWLERLSVWIKLLSSGLKMVDWSRSGMLLMRVRVRSAREWWQWVWGDDKVWFENFTGLLSLLIDCHLVIFLCKGSVLCTPTLPSSTFDWRGWWIQRSLPWFWSSSYLFQSTQPLSALIQNLPGTFHSSVYPFLNSLRLHLPLPSYDIRTRAYVCLVVCLRSSLLQPNPTFLQLSILKMDPSVNQSFRFIPSFEIMIQC